MPSSLKIKLTPFFKSLNKNVLPEDYGLCFNKLNKALNSNSLTYCVLNQILHLFNEAGISKGFFKYYFNINANVHHFYDKTLVDQYNSEFDEINISEENLLWGLSCFTTDALFIFGNIKSAYKIMRNKTFEELAEVFEKHIFHHEIMASRSDSIEMEAIKKSDRYFLSEIVNNIFNKNIINKSLENIYSANKEHDSIKECINNLNATNDDGEGKQLTVIKNIVSSFDKDMKVKDYKVYNVQLANKHNETKDKGKINNKLYLSQVNEIDIYVATSMRTKDDFNKVFDFVKFLNKSNVLKKYKLRIFDPTNCVAENPYDKGLTECLMVKCAKVLIYITSEEDSYGKDAEAAIALSLGKPVIMLCHSSKKATLFKDIHPLTRLIDIETGVACGAIITEEQNDIPILLDKIFKNEMEYEFKTQLNGNEIQHIEESITGSCIRLETSDKFLSAAFWNNYHNEI